jgi:hypothetical protein
MPNSIEDLNPEMQECLDTFQNAVFGEEVRSALIKAIELCYEDVIKYVIENVLKGDTGKSAYQLAVDNGFSGELQDWLDSLKGDPGPQGPEGPPGQIEGDGFDVDNIIDANSTNPVQNKVIKAALDGKLDASRVDVPSGQNKTILCVNNAGIIKAAGIKAGGTIFSNTPGATLLATEPGVKNYTYSKTESDSKYLTQHQDISGKANASDVYTKTQSDNKYLARQNIDSIISSTSLNPVQNRTIKAALDSISVSGVVVDTELSLSSENPVQNKVIASALNDVVTEDKIWEDINASLSFENPNNIFNTSQEFSTDFTNFPANGLFIERYYDTNYTDIENSFLSKYRYFLAYIDSDAGGSVTPSSSHWHRIIELTGLFESKQWQCQNVRSLPVGAVWTNYYPSLSCMAQYVSEQLNSRLGNFDSFDLEQLQEDYADLDRRVTALENPNSQ